ncbi:hypothetical protein [Phytohabitans flavus]|nr:hypothetical protein [Phytohabitans flavus]
MAIRTWSRVLLAALGVAMLAAASQLGVAFGLGIVRLSRTFPVDQENQWTAQMAWVCWFAMVAAVAGAVAADRMARRHGYEGGTGSRIAYSLFAGIGAAVLVPLCMQPARFAIVRDTDPVLVIGLSAALGAVAGVFVALAALSHQPLLWNVGVVSAAAWALALVSVIPSLGPDDPLPNLRLGVLDLATFSSGAAQSSAVATMPLLALAVGAACAGLGRWLGRPPTATGPSGIIGPAMLCLAYLVAGPGTETDKFQAAPYWGALVAVGAGTLGSVLAAVARRPSRRPAEPAEETAAAAPQEQDAAAHPSREPGIEPVFREPPAEGWSVPLPGTAQSRRRLRPHRPRARPPRRRPHRCPWSSRQVAEVTASPRRPSPAQAAALAEAPEADFSTSRRPTSRRSPRRDPLPAQPRRRRLRLPHARPAGPARVTREPPRQRPPSPPGAGRPATPPARSPSTPARKTSPTTAAVAVIPRPTATATPAPTSPPTSRPPPAPRPLRAPSRGSPTPEPVEPPSQIDVPTQRGGQPRPEPVLKPRDEEYVDWVSGLSSRDPDRRDPSR